MTGPGGHVDREAFDLVCDQGASKLVFSHEMNEMLRLLLERVELNIRNHLII